MILTRLLSFLTFVARCYSISENEILIPDERLKPQIGPPRTDIPSISDHLILEKEHEKELIDDFATRAIDRNVDRLATKIEDDHVVAPHLGDIQTIPPAIRHELNDINPSNDSLKPKGMYCIKYLVCMILE